VRNVDSGAGECGGSDDSHTRDLRSRVGNCVSRRTRARLWF
jgi:hypothetical protein